VSLASFHPAVRSYFEERFGAPTEVQARAFEVLRRDDHAVIAAPTGSGKTLAAFLVAIDRMLRDAITGSLPDETRVLYISPLRALSHDIGQNLEAPLAGVVAAAHAMGLGASPIRVAVRTGDTTASERRQVLKRPPHIFVTTPESLYVLLTAESGRAMLRTVRTVIVDEIHALVADRRGVHLSLSLERLDDLVGAKVQRIGLSATQKPIENVARFLVQDAGSRSTEIVDLGHRKELDLAIEMPRSPVEAILSAEVWAEVYDRIAALAREHRTTIVFVGNRRSAERTSLALAERLGTTAVATHHGSLDRRVRLESERRLREGELSVLVATNSLELGIDVGALDLVIQVGSPAAISSLLQRVGRASHHVGGTPKGRLFPTGTDDLLELIALLDAIGRGELEATVIPEGGLDVLAQQLVATVVSGPRGLDELYDLVRRAAPYRNLSRESFDAVLLMLAEGFATERGRRGALLHLDAVNQLVRPRKAARLSALLDGGTIPDTFDYEVKLEPMGLRVGTVHEDFAIESVPGDVFQLGSASYRIAKVEGTTMHVGDAHGVPPTIPFWVAEGRARSDALSASVSRLSVDADALLARGAYEELVSRLVAVRGVPEVAARLVATYLRAARAALGALPHAGRLIAERFFDEAGSSHLVVHSRNGARLNRAFALALRKRMCRAFDVELQAAAIDDAFVLSLGPQHAMPLEDVFTWLHPNTVGDVLVQAVLDRPLFETRFRWNAQRALAVPRRRGKGRVPPAIQRIRANDLLAVCFPDQVACLENIDGPRRVPDHPIVSQTVRDCTEEAMDLPALVTLLHAMREGRVETRTAELRAPSPFAASILGAKPYAFLDDAPLEERRTRAVAIRRTLDPEDAAGLGALDPEVIARVIDEVLPRPRDADELHDAALCFGLVALDAELERFALDLEGQGRVVRIRVPAGRFLVAVERASEFSAALSEARIEPSADRFGTRFPPSKPREESLRALSHAVLDRTGPITPSALATLLDASRDAIDATLGALESAGIVLRGRFTPGAATDEWCERGLLARIHRGTLDRLRRAIAPVPAAAYVRYLFRHQFLTKETQKRGVEALATVLTQLRGFEAQASIWESELLPARLPDFDPGMLDLLGQSGRFAWFRRDVADGVAARLRAKTTAIAFAPLEEVAAFRDPEREASLGSRASALATILRGTGPKFAHELMRASGMMESELDAALTELICAGLVRSDAFAGLRIRMVPEKRDRDGRRRRPTAGVGRYSIVDAPMPLSLEGWAELLLDRYGVVCRRILERERNLPPYRELLPVLRRMEAQGRVRGGRFLDGVGGEQFATDATVASLRAQRDAPAAGERLCVSACDPVNLLGLVTHGERVPQQPSHRILFTDGVPTAVLRGSEVRWIAELTHPRDADAERLLRRRPGSPLRASLVHA